MTDLFDAERTGGTRLRWVRIRREKHSAWTTWHLIGAGGVSLCGSLDSRQPYTKETSDSGQHRGGRRCKRCLRVAEAHEGEGLQWDR